MQMRVMCIRVLTVTATFCLSTMAFNPQNAAAQDSARPEVELETTEGTIKIELNPEKAPETVANFLKYVESGFYEGTVFHRVIEKFMIQGGGRDENLREKETRAPIRNEAGNGLINKKYTIAMARTEEPHSATSQFFINTADNPDLDRDDARELAGYAVFGRVVKGLDVVDTIAATKTYSRPNPDFPPMLMSNIPVKPIVIKSARVVKK